MDTPTEIPGIGRDERLIPPEAPDTGLDLALFRWAQKNNINYDWAIGKALQDWLITVLKDNKLYHEDLYEIRAMSPCRELAWNTMRILNQIPLGGDNSRKAKHRAMQIAVKRFLKQQGVLV